MKETDSRDFSTPSVKAISCFLEAFTKGLPDRENVLLVILLLLSSAQEYVFFIWPCAVLKGGSTLPDKIPASGSPVVDQQSTEASHAG